MTHEPVRCAVPSLRSPPPDPPMYMNCCRLFMCTLYASSAELYDAVTNVWLCGTVVLPSAVPKQVVVG